ncbi:hypothetical protein NLL49_09425 [Corynebacterium propinquum]|nr:hypothetical protein [Corynebacterium propinquum]WKS28846.1 hypothetical protein NLL49_09425 [Corynebacterium propinquum]
MRWCYVLACLVGAPMIFVYLFQWLAYPKW